MLCIISIIFIHLMPPLCLYQYRPEFFFVQGAMSTFSMWIYSLSPLIHFSARQVLHDRIHSLSFFSGHTNQQIPYNPNIHNTDYRQVRVNVLTNDECGILRKFIDKNINSYQNENWSEALQLEFHNVDILQMLQNSSDTASEYEQNVLRTALVRIHDHIQIDFKNENLFYQYSDATVRYNPISSKWSSLLRRWWYSTSSGHGIHADQCRLLPSNKTQENFWNHPWKCQLRTDHCCFDRTHTAILYLNSPKQLSGGELYMINRQDMMNSTTHGNIPNYISVLPMADQAKDVLTIPPTCGTLVMFTSDSRNIHGTLPMSHGRRYALANWFTSHTNLPPKSHSEASTLTLEELQQVEKNVQTLCYYDGSEYYYPAPRGLAVISHWNCTEWLKEVRDPDTLHPYSYWNVKL